jgi:long-chain-fatty-acid--[acyl-carrier-protein] ligase
MKQHHPIILKLAAGLFALLRGLLRIRYKVEVRGGEQLKSSAPKLILPNHQAIMDPILLFAHLYKYTTAVPVVTATYYDMPGGKQLFSAWGAVRVSDLEAGSRNTNVLQQIVKSVNQGLDMNKNIVLYPGGQIAGQGYERIFNKQSAHQITAGLSDNAEVMAVRIRGLWGSRWSKAWMGKSPSFFTTLLQCLGLIITNLFLFMPKRKVTLEVVNISEQAREMSRKDRKSFNTFLEDVYNQHGEEAVSYIRYHWLAGTPKRSLPSHIAGSEKSARQPGNTNGSADPEVLKKVRQCIAGILTINPDEIKQQDYLQLDLGADSLNLVEIVSEIENQFASFSAPQLNAIKTVNDLCLVAQGKFSSDEDLKPSDLNQDLSHIQELKIDANKSIKEHFIDTFTTSPIDPFCYDAMLGSTNRKTFFLKANVVAQYMRQEIKEEHVGIMLPALQSTTLLIAACYLAGKVPVMLNWTVGQKTLEHCIQTANVKTILSAGTFIEKIEEMLPESIKDKLVLLEKKVPQLSLGIKLRGAVAAKFPNLFLNKQKVDKTAVILFTSGSEAMPKAVPLSHANIVSNLSSVFSLVRLDNNQVFLSFLPPFHSFGFTVLSILPLISGIKVGYTPNPTDAREVLRIMKHISTNVLIGTPGFLKLLLSEGSAYEFKSVKWAISGAEAMPVAVEQQFNAVCPEGKILEGYGITECSPVLTVNPQDKQKLNSVGKFLPGIDGCICNPETDELLENNQPGMIYVKGPNVFEGYLKQPELHPFKTINGEQFYCTGDIGYLDDEGYLFITGRLKRFIKIAGEMISLPFIEKMLLEKYGSDEEQVLAVEGSDQSNPVKLALFTTNNINLEEANKYLLANGVAPIARLKEVIHIDEIPVLGTGKTDYKELRKMLENTSE